MEPFDANQTQWQPEDWIKRRAGMADQMWGVQPSGGRYSAFEGLLAGLGSGLGNNNVHSMLQGNQRLQQTALQSAAAAKDAPSLARTLIGSGVPPLAGQGLGVLASSYEKQADRAAQLAQQKQLFEFQKRLAMDLKQQEQKQMIEQLRAIGVLPPQAGQPQPQTPQEAPSVSPAQPTAIAAPPNPNAAFADDLLPGDSHQTPSPAQKAGIALVLGEKGKAVDALTEKGGKLTEGQTKDALFAERMLRSEADLRKVTPINEKGEFTKYDPTGYVGPKESNWYNPASWFISDEWKEHYRASREWLAVILRKDTGAAVTDQEWNWYAPTYIPMPGDTPPVILAKQRARIALAKGMRNASGPAFDQMFPQFDKQLRARLLEMGADLSPRPPPASQAKSATEQYSQIKRNPKTGEMAGYNPKTGQWEIIPGPAAAPSAPPASLESGAP